MLANTSKGCRKGMRDSDCFARVPVMRLGKYLASGVDELTEIWNVHVRRTHTLNVCSLIAVVDLDFDFNQLSN